MTGVTIAQIGDDTAVVVASSGDNVTIVQGVEAAGPPGVGGGVTDHGALTGLADDDHTQYHNDTRGDARYAQKANNLSDLANASTARTNLGLALGTDIYSKAAVDAGFQPLDSDLTAIAALSTTSFGRALLALADAAAGRTALGLGSLATLSTITTSEITDGTIVNADINASAAISLSKLATDPLARANHTGTQTASTISDFDTQVATTAVLKSNNLSDLADAPTARSNLGLAVSADSTNTAGAQTYVAPGWRFASTRTSWAFSADVAYYQPIRFDGPWTITTAMTYVNTGAASKSLVIALYAATAAWQPGARIAYTSAIDLSSTGLKTASLSASGNAGRYLLRLHANGAWTPSALIGSGPRGSVVNPNSNSDFAQTVLRKSLAYAATPEDPGTAWDTVSTNAGDVAFAFVIQTA